MGEPAGDAVQNSAGLDRQVAAALGEQLAFQTSEGNREVIRCGENIKREVLRCLGEAYIREKADGTGIGCVPGIMPYRDGHGTFTGNIYEAYSIRRGMRRQPGGSRNGAGGLCTIFGVQGDPDGIFETIYQCETVKKEERQQEAKKSGAKISVFERNRILHTTGGNVSFAGKYRREYRERGAGKYRTGERSSGKYRAGEHRTGRILRRKAHHRKKRRLRRTDRSRQKIRQPDAGCRRSERYFRKCRRRCA